MNMSFWKFLFSFFGAEIDQSAFIPGASSFEWEKRILWEPKAR